MKKKQIKLLRKIVETPSPTGFETSVADIVRAQLKPYADAIETDTMGSVHAVYEGNLHSLSGGEAADEQTDIHMDALDETFIRDNISNIDFVDVEEDLEEDASPTLEERLRGPRVLMLSTHMDEIGLMVSYISPEGFLYIASLGGVDAAILPGMRVDVHTGSGILRGVVGRKPIHLIPPDDRKSVTPLDQLVIDLGLSAKAVKKKVRVGDPITFAVGFERMGSNMAVSRAFDDKVGVFISCRVFEELASKPEFNDTFVSAITTQEEIGTRGAITSAYSVQPDVAIAFDVTHATDYPGIDKTKHGDIQCGKGPVIARGPNINPVVFDALVSAAEAEGIPYQLEAEPSVTGTDARSIQISREGVPTGLVSIPLRYMHTPTEMIDLRDVESTIRLIVRFAIDMHDVNSFVPGDPTDFESDAHIAAADYIGDFESLRDELARLREELDDYLVAREFGSDIDEDAESEDHEAPYGFEMPDLGEMQSDPEPVDGYQDDESAVHATLDDLLEEDDSQDDVFEMPDGAMIPPLEASDDDYDLESEVGTDVYVPGIPVMAEATDMASGYIPRPDMDFNGTSGIGQPYVPEAPQYQGSIENGEDRGARSVDDLRVADFRDEMINNGYPDDWQLIGIDSPFKRQQDEISAEFREAGLKSSFADDIEEPSEESLVTASAAAKANQASSSQEEETLDDDLQEQTSEPDEADAQEGVDSSTSISEAIGDTIEEVVDPFASEASDIPTIEIDIDEGDDSYYY